MVSKYVEEFVGDLQEFYDKTMQFHNKELSMKEYKGFSGGFGSYAQKGGEKHMFRLRMAGGRVTKDRLKFIAESAAKYHCDFLKLTTCQSIQFHDLLAEQVCDVIEKAWRAGMVSRGGGGDFPRNVMASALSGVQNGENFDVLPYAEAAGEFLMQFVKTVKLPRKLKVGFSNSDLNDTHVTFRDLGFASNPDGTFDVYIAGGLGNNPKMGVCVAQKADPKDIFYYIKAMVNTFVAYGNYENRAKARTRYMQDTLGRDGLLKAYLEKLEEVKAAEKLECIVTPNVINKKGNGQTINADRVSAQKQEGLYSVYYQPVGGKIKAEKIIELYNTVKDMQDVEIRVTPEDSLYVINCNADEAQKVLDVTNDGAATLFETSVACIGNSICQVGVRDSQALLSACVEAVRKENFADGVLPKIHISGCPSSCSAHQIGDMGFRGGIKKTADGVVPGFIFYRGGNIKRGQEVFAADGKAMATEEIPMFLVELGKMISEDHSVYAEWIKTNSEKLDSLVEKYTAV